MGARTKVYVDIVTKAQSPEAIKDLKKVDNALKVNEKTAKKLKTAFKQLAGPLALGAVLFTAINVTKALSTAASGAEEIGSKYATIFRDISTEAEGIADSFAKNFGLAGSTSRELLGNTADLLTGLGFTQAGALDLSEQVNTLAADLASFSNFAGGTTGASEALTKALLGEAESAKALGIVINQNTKEYKDAIKFYTEVEGLTLLQAKAYTALKFATEQSGNAIGDVRRTFESHANVTRRLEESTKALKEQIGESLNEGITPLLVETEKIVKTFSDWLEKSKGIVNFMENFKTGADNSAASMEELQFAIEAGAKAQVQMSKGFGDQFSQDLIDAGIEAQKLLNMLNATNLQMKLTTGIREENSKAQAQEAANQKLIADAFKKTDEYARQTLEAQIELFETFAKGPEVIAVLADLNAELDKMTESAEEIGEALTVAWQGPLEELNNSFLETFDLVGWLEERAEAAAEAEAARIEKGLERLKTEHEAKVEAALELEEINKQIAEDTTEREEEALEAYEETIKRKMALAQEFADLAIALINTIASISSSKDQEELMRMDDEHRKEIENAIAEGATDEELKALKEANADELDKKKRKIAHDEAIRKRDFGLFSVAIETAIAVAEAIPNPILMALAAAAGLFQAAAIDAAPIPSLATGGSYITDGTEMNNGKLIGDNASGQERHTIEPLGGLGGSSNNKDQVMILKIGDREVKGVVQGWINQRGLHSSKGGVL